MTIENKKMVESSFIFTASGGEKTEVLLGIGFPRSCTCTVYFDGFVQPRAVRGESDWQALFLALRLLEFELNRHERLGYIFELNECRPPLPMSAMEIISGMSFEKTDRPHT